MEIIPTAIFLLLFLFNLISIYMKYQEKQKKRSDLKLPPGSMGWPYIGETSKLYSQDPNVFFSTKQKRYGDVFKTNILGYPCVMLASPEAARFVLVTHAHLFKPTYPKSKEKLLGPWALFFHQGEYHNRLRKLVQSSLSPEAIRKCVPDIENIAVSCLDSWAATGRVANTFHQMKMYAFEVGVLAIFGHLDEKYRYELKENYFILDKGYNSFPFSLPGTSYHNALLARKKLNQILKEIICERKEKKITLERDLLGHLLNYKDEKGQTLTEDQIADNVIGVLFAAQDTTASALTWIIKYLNDNHKVLQSVKVEQLEIFKENDGGKKHMTWAQTRKMPFTFRVILESLRMASIISFTFREAVVDVEYDGYLIPKGWKVMPLFRIIHHNPELFKDPQNFDPSRFKDAPKPNTYMPFGNGAHACPGNELAKLQMLILIHHLVTNFRCLVTSPQGLVQYSPFPVPQHGLPARLYKKSNHEEISFELEDSDLGQTSIQDP